MKRNYFDPVETFVRYAEIYSPSGSEEKIREVLEKDLETLKISYKKDSYGNIFTTSTHPEPILFTAHMDTVEPGENIRVVEEGGFLVSAGETIVGGDNKAGLAGIIAGLAKAKSKGKSLENIELLFTIEEESGLQGVQNVDFSVFNATRAISFDKSGGNFGEIIVEKCIFGYNIFLEIFGKSSHAGKPENGINALQIFLDAFAGFRLGRVDNETTINFGILSAGRGSNTVPEKLSIRGDIRSFSKEKIFELEREMREALKTSTSYLGGRFELRLEKVLPGFFIDKNSTFVQKISEELSKFGISPEFIENFGGVEVAYFFEHGIESLVLSCGVFDPHTVNEKVHIESLKKTAEFVSNLVK